MKSFHVPICVALILSMAGCQSTGSALSFVDNLLTGANGVWAQINQTVTKGEFEAFLKLVGVTDANAIATIEKLIGFVGPTLTITSDIASKLDAALATK